MNPNPKRSVSVEDLLRLKRGEAPPEGFWPQFEDALRAKQLAAIVAKRPWWASLTRGAGALGRYQIVFGGAAALAVVFAGYREYGSVALAKAGAVARVAAAPATVAVAPQTRAPDDDDLALADDHADVAAAESRVSARPAPPAPAAFRQAQAPAAPQATAFSENEPWLPRLETRIETPSARTIAANLAAAQADEPEVVRAFQGISKDFDTRLVAEAAPIATEPLTQMTFPAEDDHARLVAQAAVPTARPSEAQPSRYVPLRDRYIDSLSDERTYREISRYSVGDGDHASLSIKF